jgi:hypothetical protein
MEYMYVRLRSTSNPQIGVYFSNMVRARVRFRVRVRVRIKVRVRVRVKVNL